MDSDRTAIRVYIKQPTQSTWTLASESLAATTVTFKITGLTNFTDYDVSVRTVDAWGNESVGRTLSKRTIQDTTIGFKIIPQFSASNSANKAAKAYIYAKNTTKTGAPIDSKEIVANQEFSFYGLTTNNDYDVVIRVAGQVTKTLSYKASSVSVSTLNFGSLVGGDLNGDDQVNFDDFVILLSGYNKKGDAK